MKRETDRKKSSEGNLVWLNHQLLTLKQTHKLAGMKITALLEIAQASTTRHHICASQLYNTQAELTQIFRLEDVEIGLQVKHGVKTCTHTQ